MTSLRGTVLLFVGVRGISGYDMEFCYDRLETDGSFGGSTWD